MTDPHRTLYTQEQLIRVRSTLLQVLVAVDDFRDDIVLVGGLVPSLLIDQVEAAARDDAHVGTVDVDLGVGMAVVDEQRYDDLAQRLRASGFEPDLNEKGNPAKQRWRFASETDAPADPAIVIDFLIDETETGKREWGRTLPLTSDLAALRTLGLRLAFDDVVERSVSGRTMEGDRATRSLLVCGPAAFVVLKAVALRNRGKEKDAYDLVYALRNWPSGLGDVARRWQAFGDHPAASAARALLGEDFASEESVGGRKASRFLYSSINDEYVADAVGDVRRFLALAGE